MGVVVGLRRDQRKGSDHFIESEMLRPFLNRGKNYWIFEKRPTKTWRFAQGRLHKKCAKNSSCRLCSEVTKVDGLIK